MVTCLCAVHHLRQNSDTDVRMDSDLQSNIIGLVNLSFAGE